MQGNSAAEPSPLPVRPWFCADLGTLSYGEARELQLGLVGARKTGAVAADVLLLLEHPPVFTLGRRGGLENVTVSEAFLREAGIPVVHVERGGNVTYHGPGQLIGYPIMDLHAAGMSVTAFVESLEEVMIRTAANWDVQAGRSPINRGVWAGNHKLGSIGIAVRRGITFHGFALNVNLSLEPFAWINPCGLRGVGVTSLSQLLSREIPMNEVRERVKGEFETVFRSALTPVDPMLLRQAAQGSLDCTHGPSGPGFRTLRKE